MPSFEIPDGPTTIEAPRSADPKNPQPAETSAVYNVTNRSSEVLEAYLSVRTTGSSKLEWFTVEGEGTRTFGAGETQTVTVRVKFPPDVPAGAYPFSLRVVSANDPDNDFAEGPVTTAKLGPGGTIEPNRWWLWILLGVLALIAAAGTAYFLWPDPPPETKKEVPTELDAAQAKALAQKRAMVWLAAFSKHDIDALVGDAEPPFFIGDRVVLSKAQARERYTAILTPETAEKHAAMEFDTFTVQAISELTKETVRAHFRSKMPLAFKDEDIFVNAGGRGGAIILFYRRSPTDVKLTGVDLTLF